jgi:hypothetical protein
MAGIQQSAANSILDTLLAAGYTMRLYTVAPTVTTNGTEVSGSSYVPTAISFSAASAGSKTQNADCVFAACTAAPYTINGWAITDLSNVIKVFRAFTALTVNIGDTVRFASGTVVVSLA